MSSDYIEFPNLGLKFHVSPYIFQIGNFSLKWYGLLIAIGFLLAVVYALKRAKQFDIDPDRMIDVTLVSALFAFVGARLYYVLFSGDVTYIQNPLSILYVWKGGLAIYGGVIFAFATAIWMCRVRKVNTMAMFDIASLGFLIGQAVGRWGNFFNQEAFGGNTSENYLLGMTGSIIRSGVNQNYRISLPVHPTFLYESLWCILGFVLLHFVSKKAYKFKGEIFSLYIIWYGAGRFFIEGLRTDSLMFGRIRISQLIAVLAVIGGIVLFFLLRAYRDALPKDLFAEGAADGNGIPLNEDYAAVIEGGGSAAAVDEDIYDVADDTEDGSDKSQTAGEQSEPGAADVDDAAEAPAETEAEAGEQPSSEEQDK